MDVDKFTSFFPTGRSIERAISKTLPKTMTEADVENLIYEGLKKGKGDPKDLFAYIYEPNKYGIAEMRIIFDNKGRIISAYPTKGSNVWAWDPKTNLWILKQ